MLLLLKYTNYLACERSRIFGCRDSLRRLLGYRKILAHILSAASVTYPADIKLLSAL